jgi:hypothetical protein
MVTSRLSVGQEVLLFRESGDAQPDSVGPIPETRCSGEQVPLGARRRPICAERAHLLDDRIRHLAWRDRVIAMATTGWQSLTCPGSLRPSLSSSIARYGTLS